MQMTQVAKGTNTTNTKNGSKYNKEIIKRLMEKHGLSKVYIYQCLSGARNSETAETVRKQYKEFAQKISEALK